MNVADLLSTFVVFACGLVGVFIVDRGFKAKERAVLWAGFFAHVGAAALMVWITGDVLGGGDMFWYHRLGSGLADAMRADFFRVAPNIVSVILHEPSPLPVPIHGQGSATGAMTSLSSFILLFVGNSLYGACMLISIAVYFSRIALFRVITRQLGIAGRPSVAVACLLLPSVTFWGSALLKEPLAFCGLALVILGLDCASRARVPSAVLYLAVGALLVGVLKAYILMPVAFALGAWVYVSQAGRGNALRYIGGMAAAVVLGMGLTIAVGELFPRYSLTNFGEEAAHLQLVGQTRTSGGAQISLTDPGDGSPAERGPLGQLVYAPAALGTALFRPAIFDVNNAPMLVNALETTVLTIAFIVGLVRNRLRGILHLLSARPFFAFCVVFVLIMALGVGLTTTNLGSLSRYRMPMMPLFAALLAAMCIRQQSATAEPRNSVTRLRPVRRSGPQLAPRFARPLARLKKSG